MQSTKEGAGDPRPRASRWRAAAVATVMAGVVLVLGAATTSTLAGAQAQPPVTTLPCADCGPGAPGDGTHVWSFTEFFCQPQRGFVLNFGVGRKVDEPVNFSAGIAPDSVSVVAVSLVKSNVPPGGSGYVLLDAPLSGLVKVRVVGVGARTGRVLLDNTRVLECNCTDTTTTTPVTTVPEQVTTTVPGSSTTDASTTTSIVATSIGRTTTIPGTLPKTGSSSSGPLAAGGLALLGVGIVALAFTRRRTADLD